MRIVRALAVFRPSLIALQMPLTEEDEIFVERSLQRTVLVSFHSFVPHFLSFFLKRNLLREGGLTQFPLSSVSPLSSLPNPKELEKLISFSGTPTVVWRRTCEICVVGAEFSMLTQWSREHLLGRFIYQFLEKESSINYWETFALHAFDAGRQSVSEYFSLIPSKSWISETLQRWGFAESIGR